MVAEVVGQFVHGVGVVALPCRGSRCGELWSMVKLLSQLVFFLEIVAPPSRGSNELGALVAWWWYWYVQDRCKRLVFSVLGQNDAA